LRDNIFAIRCISNIELFVDPFLVNIFWLPILS
jgi:hypothetical protein